MAGRPLMISGIATLLRLSATARRPMISSVLLATLATGLEIVPYFCVFRAVSTLLEPNREATQLATLGIVAAGAVLGRHLLWGHAMHLSHRAAFAVFQQVQLRIATRLNRVPLGYLTSRRSGEIQSLLRDEGGKIELFLAHAVPEMMSAVVAWAVITTWLIAVDWRMALVTAVVVPVAFGLLTVAFRSRSTATERDVDWVNLRNGYPPSEWVSPEMAQHALIAPHFTDGVFIADPASPGKEPPTRTPTGCSASTFPKRTDLSRVTKAELLAVQTRLDNRSRKILS